MTWLRTVMQVSLLYSSASIAAPARQELPTGQAITPLSVAGSRFSPLVARVGPHPSYVADGAAALAISPDKREMLVLTSGYNAYNGADGKLVPAQSTQYVFRFEISDSGARWLQTLQVPNSFGGIAWRPDGRGFIVGGGVDDALFLFDRHGSRFERSGIIRLGHKAGLGADVMPQAAGVAFSPDGKRALVANYYNDSVSLIDVQKRTVVAEQDLRPGKISRASIGIAGGEFPYAIVWTGRDRAWVSSPRDRQIVRLSIASDNLAVGPRMSTIGEPTLLFYDAPRNRIIATEDNDDRLAIIDQNTGKLTAEIRLRLPVALFSNGLGKGLNPNGVTSLPDGRLLVTLGGINALAMVVPQSPAAPVQALIPTAWYPSGVGVSASGRRLFVINRKSPPGPNVHGCAPALAIYRGQPNACGAANEYIFQLEKAGLLDLPLPSPEGLVASTLQVAKNIGIARSSDQKAATQLMSALRDRIKHVIFIIKENRTYDQVLGDLEVGNGDPHLAILGKALSPNHHRLARQFVTFDNFYDSGEQSSTGWTWSTAARVPDLLEKTAPVNYAKRGLAYEAEEADRFVYTQQTPQERHAANPALSPDPDLLPGPALLTAPDPDDDDRPNQGFLWNAAIRAGITVRNYGFSDASIYESGVSGSVPVVREPFKEHRLIYTAGDRQLASRSDPYFRGFDQKLPDFWRVREWEREYDEEEASGTVPTLTLLRLSHDHFGDFDKAIDGVDTVETEMADNDYSLGLVVERIARGKAANSTLIFVIEDDAQNGADHVDARRSVAFILGPYVRQGSVNSTRYTTINVLRTIELVLGLSPMNINDALAAPMADAFDLGRPGWTYRASAADVLRTTKLPIAPDRFVAVTASAHCRNHSPQYWANAMAGQDFRTEDKLDTDAFNRALWAGLGSGVQSSARDGKDLRKDRASKILVMEPAPCASLE